MKKIVTAIMVFMCIGMAAQPKDKAENKKPSGNDRPTSITLRCNNNIYYVPSIDVLTEYEAKSLLRYSLYQQMNTNLTAEDPCNYLPMSARRFYAGNVKVKKEEPNVPKQAENKQPEMTKETK